MRLVNKIGYLAKKIEEYDQDFYEVRDAHNHNESYIARIDKCYTELQKEILKIRLPQMGGGLLTTEGAGGRRKAKSKCSRKTRRSRK